MSYTPNRRAWLLVVAAVLAGACSDDNTSEAADAGPKADQAMAQDGAGPDRAQKDLAEPDAAQKDLAPPDMAPPDMAPPDMSKPDQAQPDQAQPDMAVPDMGKPDQAQPDMAQPDMAVPDMGKPNIPQQTVLYVSSAAASSKLAPMLINTDGTGKKAHPTLPASFMISALQVGTAREFASVTRHGYMPMGQVYSAYQPIQLPGKQGYLYQLAALSPAARAFYQVRLDGTATLLESGPGPSPYNSYHFFVSPHPDGTMFAALYAHPDKAKAAVKLIRTDGKKFSGNNSAVCDITPASPKSYHHGFMTIHFAGGRAWFVGRDAVKTSQHYLFSANTDCSAKATPVSLPLSGGKPPVWIEDEMRLTHDGKHLIVTGGVSYQKEDIFIVDTAKGTSLNLTDDPAWYVGPGYYLGLYYTNGSSTHVDVSPGKKYAAFIKYQGYDYELYVRPLDKSKAAVHVTGPTNFSNTLDETHGILWATDDDLLLWAGPSSSNNMDLFHYKVSTGAVVNLTLSGGATKPFALGGKMHSYGGWRSPNGKYLYFMQHDASTPGQYKCNIRALELGTMNITDITSGLYVDYTNKNLESTPGATHKVFFYARPPGSNQADNLYVFDQNTASAPVKLTSFTAPGSGSLVIQDIIPSHDGSQVAFAAGPSKGALHVYVSTAGPTPKTTQLTTTPGHAMDMKLFSSDNKALVYGVGPAWNKIDLRVSAVDGSGTKVLEPAQGYTSVLGVF